LADINLSAILPMIGLKSQQTLLVLGFVAVLSAIYATGAYALLQPLRANVDFTSKEIHGLSDYERFSALYFELNASRTPEDEAKATTDRNLRELIQGIGDKSNLILDPELSSYYAANLLFNDVLFYVENILARIGSTSPPPLDLPYHISTLEHSVEAICRSASDDCPKLKAQTADFERSLFSQDVTLRPEQATALIGSVQNIAQTSIRILRHFLEEHLQEQVHRQRVMLAELAGLYVVLVFLIGFSSLNFVRKREFTLAKEAHKLADQLAQKNDELEKFAHAAAHDLKEPVRTMRCYATLLKSEEMDALKPSSAEYIGIIERAAKRAEQMINDLLDYSQVSEKPLALEACDSAKELHIVLEDLKPLIDKLRPDITMSELPVVWVVPSMFRRLMANLLDNAIKYRRLGSPPAIHIEAKKQNAFWVFSVRDNGIGIAKKHIKTVFEPFKRLNPSYRHDGQGIGLTSCKKIVERLGGKIWIVSDLDEGTTVYFSLPAIQEEKRE
jgi:signal transduction histidine kinase